MQFQLFRTTHVAVRMGRFPLLLSLYVLVLVGELQKSVLHLGSSHVGGLFTSVFNRSLAIFTFHLVVSTIKILILIGIMRFYQELTIEELS